jgi:signal transduction histidine kinase
LGAIVFILLAVLDYVSIKDKFPFFLFLRFIISIILFVIVYLSIRFDHAKPVFHTILSIVAIFSSALTIEIMILNFHGHESPYYAGQILLAILAIGVVPANLYLHLIHAVGIYLIYAGPILIFDTISNPKVFFISNFFLVSCISTLVLLRCLAEKSISSELGLRFEIEEHKNNLESNVIKRTEDLNNALHMLRKSERKYKELSLHLQMVREEERRKVAREIHDELGQELTFLHIELVNLNGTKQGKVSEIHDELKEMSGLTKQMIGTVQRITSELRPGMIDTLGLVAAIENDISKYSKHLAINLKIQRPFSEKGIDPEVSITLYRVFQEAMTNILRHSGADSATIALERKDRVLHLEIADNGKGISGSQKNDSKSFGILGMQERVRLLGGTIDIEGIVNGGTRVHIKTPSGTEND